MLQQRISMWSALAIMVVLVWVRPVAAENLENLLAKVHLEVYYESFHDRGFTDVASLAALDQDSLLMLCSEMDIPVYNVLRLQRRLKKLHDPAVEKSQHTENPPPSFSPPGMRIEVPVETVGPRVDSPNLAATSADPGDLTSPVRSTENAAPTDSRKQKRGQKSSVRMERAKARKRAASGEQADWAPLLVSDWTERRVRPRNTKGAPVPEEEVGFAKRAIEIAQTGRLDLAIPLFVRAMFDSVGPTDFAHVAVAVTDHAMSIARGGKAASGDHVVELMRVANAAMDCALLAAPYNGHTLNELRRIRFVGKSIAPTACTMSGCGERFPHEDAGATSSGLESMKLREQEAAVSSLLQRAYQQFWDPTASTDGRSLRHQMLVSFTELCKRRDFLRVGIFRPEIDRDGWDEAASRPTWVSWLASIRRALTVNRFCGAVILHQVLPKSLTQQVRHALVPVMAEFNVHVDATKGQRNASWQMLYNPITPGARRFHGQVPMSLPFTDPALIWPAQLKQTLVAMFTGNKQIEIGRYSFVTAMSDSQDQNWHKDVDEPYKNFDGAGTFEEVTVLARDDPLFNIFPIPPPAPGALVFFAIHDVPEANGPTELTCGSHIFSSTELGDVTNGQIDRTLSYKVPLKEGDIMVMDIRTQHHGTGNRLADPRTVLYIQYVQDFFIDRGNFPEKQTKNWDALPNLAMQKLLSRLDHSQYTAMLESMLVDSGVVGGEEGLQELRAMWWLGEGHTPESLTT